MDFYAPETTSALLVCEDRGAGMNGSRIVLQGAPYSTPCRNTPTPHRFSRSVMQGGATIYFLFSCDTCGHERVWGGESATLA